MSPRSESEDDISSLERARERLYAPNAVMGDVRRHTTSVDERELPHAWKEDPPPPMRIGKKHVQFAGIFLGVSFLFFLISLVGVTYFFYYGGNSVSVDKVAIDIQGPTAIAGGDTVPLAVTITNKNSVAIEHATIEVDFPNTTRSATDVLSPYPRYVEDLGTIESGATVTRSIKAVLFGGEGQNLELPLSLSYGANGSNATFVKKATYAVAISSTPLSLSVNTLTETVSGKPLTLTLLVRSNATVPLQDVVLSPTFPFGFSITSSSIPLVNSSFLIGTMQPGTEKTITLTGTLTGQDKEQRVFHFSVGTAKSAKDQTLAVSYVTQEAAVAITAPFINTSISINGDTRDSVVVSPGSSQNITVSYINTLSTNVTNAEVAITVSGAAVDYNSIRAQSGFYRSSDHTIVFSRDTDAALATLAPGASGVGAFTFSTLPLGTYGSSPTIAFTTSVSGTREGQSNVPEQVTASVTKSAKVATAVMLGASSLHSSGPLAATGPVPPRANSPTTYTVAWNLQNKGSTVAGGTVKATLPGYVTYAGKTAGSGTFSFDTSSHTVTWNAGDIPQGASVQGFFQVTITPSTSQKGTSPPLTGVLSFTGYDRFAGVSVTASANPSTTDTPQDPGYVPGNALVQ